MSETEKRGRIVVEARSWIGTPYMSNQMVKNAGVDCAKLLLAVYRNSGCIPDFDPGPYSPQWHLSQSEEKYLNTVLAFAHEIPGPPRPADVVLFKIARTFAHGAIVTEWPRVVHARAPGKVWEEDISLDSFGKHALWRLPQRFFSLFG